MRAANQKPEGLQGGVEMFSGVNGGREHLNPNGDVPAEFYRIWMVFLQNFY